MKKLIVVSFLLVFVSSGFSQFKAEDLRLDVIVSPVKLSFDGEKSFFESPALFGFVFDLNLFGLDLTPGLYSSFSVDTKDDSDFKLGVVPYVKLYKGLGAGLYYDFWLEGQGVKWVNKENTGFVVGLDISL